MKKILRLALGIIAIFGASGVVAQETITFHSDFDEADLSLISNLNIDTPSPNLAGPGSGNVALDTVGEQLDLLSNGANMWTTRNGAPIAWVAAPSVIVGQTWFTETYVTMEDGTGGNSTYKQAGITFYGGPDGANPGDTAAPALILNDWNNWNAQQVNLSVGGVDNQSNADIGSAAGVFLRSEITEGGDTDTYNFFYKLNAGDEWTQMDGIAVNRMSDTENSRVGLFIKSHGNNTNALAQFDYFTVGTLPAPEGASISLLPDSLSLQLVAPDMSTNGTVTATYTAGASSANDITIISALADAGFSADPIPDLGTGNMTEEITVIFDNTSIGLANGESTNSTLEVIWSEIGSGVNHTSEVALAVTYINVPSSLELDQDTLSLELAAPDTSVDGTILASFAGGTLATDVDVISVVSSNSDFSAVPVSFVLDTLNTNETITVTYNNGTLVNHGDTAASTLVVTWTEAGSGVTNTTDVALDVSYNQSSQISKLWSIGMDFGGTAPAGAYTFNQVGPFGGNNTTEGVAADAVLTYDSLLNTDNELVAGVEFAFTNAGQISWDIGLGGAGAVGTAGDGALITDESVYADGLICNDASGRPLTAGVDFMYFTFTGLDDSLIYDLSAGWDNGNGNFNETWAADGQSVTTTVDGSGGGYASLTGLSTDGSGNLVVSLTGNGGAAHITVAGLTLTAFSLAPSEIGDATISILSGGTEMVICWEGVGGANTYAIEATDSLVHGIWTPIQEGIAGVNGQMCVTNSITKAYEFYRVVLEE
ncbi:hypothetical protein P4C99_09005 [Pontiellaceae bacterium B1224]|nr:hypothetical protein [Pontiellaceae bacterium B1224]